jgi:hypothetical protein
VPSIDPILPVYSEWFAARSEWEALAKLEGNENYDDPRSLEASRKEFAAFDQLITMQPASPAGIAALAHVAWVTDKLDQNDEPLPQIMMSIWNSFTQRGIFQPVAP